MILHNQQMKNKSILKERLINNNGQLDVGSVLCEDFTDESTYSHELFDDFIICSNDINERL